MNLFNPVCGKAEKVVVLLNRVLEMAGGLVFLKLLTFIASKEVLGIYFLANSLITLLLTISFSALSQGVLRNVAGYIQDNVMAIKYTALNVLFLCIAPFFAWLFLTLGYNFKLFDSLEPLKLLLILWFTSDALKILNNSVALALRKRYLNLIIIALDCTIKIGSLLFYSFIFEVNSVSLILYIYICSSFSVFLFHLFVNKNWISPIPFKVIKFSLTESLNFAWPLMIWGAFGWTQNMFGRWLLAKYHTTESVADFGIIMSLGTTPILAIFGVLTNYYTPIIYSFNDPKSSFTYLAKLCIKVMAFIILVTIMINWQSDNYIQFMTSDKYTSYSNYLFLVSTGTASVNLGIILSSCLLVIRKPSWLILPNILPGICTIFAGIYIVPHYGVLGAIYIYLFSCLLGTILHVGIYFYSLNNIYYGREY